MTNLLEKIKTEYGDKIFISEGTRVKYAHLQELTGTEKKLYDMLQSHEDKNTGEIIKKSPSFDTIYNFSTQRSNLISWLPLKKGAKVLEIGSECGAITSYLVRNTVQVDALDISIEKCAVNLLRNKEFDNLTVYAGSFLEFEEKLAKDYDYILIVNYSEDNFNTDKLSALCRKLKQHLINDGKIVLACNNRLGLKFFNGAKENAEAGSYAGIVGKTNNSFSKEVLCNALTKSGIKEFSFYYPYPDYRFTNIMFSDRRLPQAGELTDNNKNLDGDRLRLFDEKGAFDSLVKDGIFDRFANSFLVVMGNEPEIVYAKFSTERAPQTALITTIEKTVNEGSDKFKIKKRAIFNEGREHLSNMECNYTKLCDKYSNCDLIINKCLGLSDDGMSVSFEYVKGITLSELLDSCIDAGNTEEFMTNLNRYLSFLQVKCDLEPYNKDVIFDNILINENGWHLIDYEWCDNEKMDYREIAFRALHTYLVGNKKRNIFNYDLIFETLGITPEQGALINQSEAKFQQKVKGNCQSLADLNVILNNKVIEPLKAEFDDIFKFQVYRCDSAGSFSEDNSYFVDDAFGLDNQARVLIELTEQDKMIRLDPVMTSCAVKLKSIMINDNIIKLKKKKIITNGRFVKPDTYIFETSDPNIILNLDGYVKCVEKGRLVIEMDVFPLPADVVNNLSRALARF